MNHEKIYPLKQKQMNKFLEELERSPSVRQVISGILEIGELPSEVLKKPFRGQIAAVVEI